MNPHECTEVEAQRLTLLLANRQRFLAFLEKRVGRTELAEELLQDALLRAVARADTLRDEDAVTPWFYRILRNVLTDHYRRRGVEQRALDSAAVEPQLGPDEPDHELLQTVCACLLTVVRTLKPEYADVLRSIDLEEQSLDEYAKRLDISNNHAAVRLHRARKSALRQLLESCGGCAADRCEDCTCHA